MDLTVERAGESSVLTVVGELDSETGNELLQAVQGEIEGGVNRLVLDLGGASFVDSSGLGALIRSREAVVDHDGQVVLRHPSRQISQMLHMTALADYFTTED